MQRFIQIFMASIILTGCAPAPKSNAIDGSNVAICDSQKSQDCSSAKNDIEPITNEPKEEDKEGGSSKARSKIEDTAVWIVAIPAMIMVALVVCPFRIFSNSDNEFC